MDYFKPLEVVGEPNTRFHLSRLLDVQVENILLDNGSMDLSPPGMRNLKEYFTIFEEPARRRREQMTRSILRGLKKRFVPAGRYQSLSDEGKLQYRQKIAAHLDFCDKTTVGQSRRYAVSFFFQAITVYLSGHDTQKRIIARLIQEEAGRLESRYGKLSGETLFDQLQSGPDDAFFDIFRFSVTSLFLAGTDLLSPVSFRHFRQVMTRCRTGLSGCHTVLHDHRLYLNPGWTLISFLVYGCSGCRIMLSAVFTSTICPS